MITEVFVNPLSDTSVNVSWESVTVRGIVSYTVFYSPTSQQDEQMVTVPSSESSVVIEGLMTNVEYQFQVAAIAQLGEALFHRTEISSHYNSGSTTHISDNHTSSNTHLLLPHTKVTKSITFYGCSASSSFHCCPDITITAIVTFLLTTLLITAVWLMVGISLYCVHNARKKR